MVGPISRALHAAGATIVDASKFRMLNRKGSMETPLVATTHVVWALADKRITEVRKRKWHSAVHRGPHVRGDAMNFSQDVKETVT